MNKLVIKKKNLVLRFLAQDIEKLTTPHSMESIRL
jgi:hypothetical protein